MNLYKRAAEIFRKNGVDIANYNDDEEDVMRNNEGVEYGLTYMYDGTEIARIHNPVSEE